MPSGVFSIVPDNFFSPLVGANRQHYAALLVLYYRLFQENTRGLERELVTKEFTNYLALHHDSLAEEHDEAGPPPSGPALSGPANTHPASSDSASAERELDFGGPPSGDDGEGLPQGRGAVDDRALASRFLRRLVAAGWLGEEMLPDYTRVVNITAWGKPFFEALVRVEEGLKTEYESHVVNVYSSLCGETVRENGHFMVLKAREEARALIDSLKVLSQSIKGFYDDLNAEAIRTRAASVLREHYDQYAPEVLDKAYKRLKTSDNVSRYRQSILRQTAELLRDEAWLDASAGRYMRILQASREECRRKLVSMLEEIRDDLKSVDPLEDEIDRRNADYSRASTEIIKAHIEPDSTVAGKIGLVVKALHAGGDGRLAHGLYRLGFLSPASVAFRRQREEGEFAAAPSGADREALERSEAEFLVRMGQRLSTKRIRLWLDGKGGEDSRLLLPEELITDGDSYIRFVYALLYGDSRSGFDYLVEGDGGDPVGAAGYVVPGIGFRRKSAGGEGA